MVEYELGTLEGLASHIDRLLDERGREIYHENRDRHLPVVLDAMQGVFGEDQPEIAFASGDEKVDALFFHLLDPSTITCAINRGGGFKDCNTLLNDICRNGLGPNQYEKIAGYARRLILRELEAADPTGEEALTYLEERATSPVERWKARRDWVGFLNSYATSERITRDSTYVAERERYLRGEKIDVAKIRKSLPSGVTHERLHRIAVEIMTSLTHRVSTPDNVSDYFIRNDVLDVLETICTADAIESIREGLTDPQPEVRRKAIEILDGLT